MSWNTKRDGYYSSSYNPNSLGPRVTALEPREGITHAVIIPGTTYKCFLTLDESGESTPDRGTGRYVAASIKLEYLLKRLSSSTIPGPGKRRIKAKPVVLTIAEYNSLQTETKAA